MLRHVPRTTDEHRARYPLALARVWTLEDQVKGGKAFDGPLLHEEHLFDFADGMRLVVSRDDLGEGYGVHLHVIAVATPGSLLHRGMRRGVIRPEDFRRLARQRFGEVSGRPMPCDLVVSGMGYPHWYEREGS